MTDLWHIRARERARALGLTYQQIADRLDVSKATVGHWLTGRYRPDRKRLRQLAAVLQLPLGDLVPDDAPADYADDTERRALYLLRDMPAEYRAQAIRMLESFRAFMPDPQATDDDAE